MARTSPEERDRQIELHYREIEKKLYELQRQVDDHERDLKNAGKVFWLGVASFVALFVGAVWKLFVK